jgi:hypothetical protein
MFVVVLIIFVFLGMFLDLSSIGSEEEADGSIKSLRTMVPIAFYKFNTGMLECVIFAV